MDIFEHKAGSKVEYLVIPTRFDNIWWLLFEILSMLV